MLKMFSVAMPELRISLSCGIFSEWRQWNQEPENLNCLNGWTQHKFLSLLPSMLRYSTHSAIAVQTPVFTFPSMDKCSFFVTENIIKCGDYSCNISTVIFYSKFLGKALEFNTVAERFRLLHQPPLHHLIQTNFLEHAVFQKHIICTSKLHNSWSQLAISISKKKCHLPGSSTSLLLVLLLGRPLTLPFGTSALLSPFTDTFGKHFCKYTCTIILVIQIYVTNQLNLQ